MIYFIKFSPHGKSWKTFYAEHVEELGSKFIAQNVQYGIPSFEGQKKKVRVFKERQLEIECGDGGNIVFAYKVAKPDWFQMIR